MNFESYYKSAVPKPDKSAYRTTYYYKAGKLLGQKTDTGFIGQRKGTGEARYEYPDTAGCVSETIDDLDAYVVAQRAYVREENRLIALFFDDLKADLGIVDNPKADLLVAKAWELEHSNGFSAVHDIACNLVDLIR